MTHAAMPMDAANPGTDSPEQWIVTAIRNAVLNQQLPSATKLPESRLADIFGVNRAIVRSALVRLAGDRIVVMRRNQSAMVASPSPEQTTQLFSARRTIEAEVVRETAGRLSARAIERLTTLVEDEKAAHEAQAHEQRIQLSLHFHEVIAQACPNQVLGEILMDLILRSSVAVALYKVPGMAACYRCTDHRAIADALISGDAEAAADASTTHLLYLEQRLNHARQHDTVDLAAILGG